MSDVHVVVEIITVILHLLIPTRAAILDTRFEIIDLSLKCRLLRRDISLRRGNVRTRQNDTSLQIFQPMRVWASLILSTS